MHTEISKQQDLVVNIYQSIWHNPETGYKEWKTHATAKKAFEDLGYVLTEAGDIPGFYTDIDTGRPGPCIALMGELDSVICAAHPAADPQTGAVHACGHAAQIAGLVGAAAALKEPGVLDGFSGRIRLMAVPAEELLEIGFRDGLRQNGTIHYYGGKVEFLYRGFFDGVDMALMVHTANMNTRFSIVRGGNGCLLKNVLYQGKAAHAGGSPHLGINALYAATLGLQAVNSLRETFVENDYIRFHPIITEGGQMVNAIPDQVKVESYVRGATWDAIIKANDGISRAMAAGALAIGANLILGDRPGYSPLHNDPWMSQVCAETLTALYGGDAVEVTDHWDTGSTDMGDLSEVMPALQIYVAGATGHGHGADYFITDPAQTCLDIAECLVSSAKTLLTRPMDESMREKKKTKEEYFSLVDSLFLDGPSIEYEDGRASVIWK